MADREFLQSLGAGEGIIVMRRKEHQIVAHQGPLDHHRGGEAAVDRDHRIGAGQRKREALLLIRQHEQLFFAQRACSERIQALFRSQLQPVLGDTPLGF